MARRGADAYSQQDSEAPQHRHDSSRRRLACPSAEAREPTHGNDASSANSSGTWSTVSRDRESWRSRRSAAAQFAGGWLCQRICTIFQLPPDFERCMWSTPHFALSFALALMSSTSCTTTS